MMSQIRRLPDWIRQSLSAEQLDPFVSRKRNASILAAAGSGKTRTLVNLLAADLAEGLPPSGIIAFTFTEKAAGELLARIHALVASQLPEVDLSGIFVGTIHAWCLQFLLQQADFYNISSIDDLHFDALVSRLYDSLELGKIYRQPYPRGIPKFLADLEVFYNEHLPNTAVPPFVRPAIDNFLGVLKSNRLMTFGGMIRAAADHLLTNGPLPELKALYVDEYQDVNPAQVTLIKAMASNATQVTVVGDDLQCIYQWRGSDVTRILEFPNEFKDVSVHRLSTNYRSRPTIVETANHVSDFISLRDPQKKMLPGRPAGNALELQWLSLADEDEQVASVCEIVSRFAREGVPWNSMAVLLRSVQGAGRPFVAAFEAAGIPVVCPTLSRGGRFIEEVVIPIFDWLRREHTTPRNEVEEAEAETLANGLWNSVRPWMSIPDAELVFWKSLDSWRTLIEQKKSKAYDVRGRFYDLLDECSVRVRPADSDLMVALGIASQIIRSVEEIHRRRIAGQSRRTPRGIISEVYHALIRRYQDFGESIPIERIGEGVFVSTVHQAKGLEWPVVILPMLKSRRFPVNPSSHGTSYPNSIAARYGTTADDERRLFYVATTRARERLFLIDPVRNEEPRRSTFLTELASRGLSAKNSISQLSAETWKLSKNDLTSGELPPLRIPLSDLLVYFECPFQFGLRRVVAIQPAIGDELGFGQSLHELIQRRLESGKPWTDAELTQHANDHVFLPYTSETSEEVSRRAIKERMRALEKLGALCQRVETEIPVDFVFDGAIVSGIVDLVQVQDDGHLWIRDWKSSLHQEFLARYRRQLQFYAVALRAQKRQVTKADIVDIAASSDAGNLVTTSIDVSEEATTGIVSQAQAAVRALRLGQYPSNPSKETCSMCDLRRVCAERAD